MRKRVLTAAVLLFVVSAGAQSAATDVELKPGLIKADSPIYFLDTFEDRASQLSGLRSHGSVAYEKASEYAVAEQRNNTQAMARAEEQLNQVALAASNKSYTGLRNAEQVLLQVQSRVDENASEGLETALGNVRDAQQRQPEKNGLLGFGGPSENNESGDRGSRGNGVIPDLGQRQSNGR